MLKDVDLKNNKADVNDIMLNQQFTLEDLIGMLELFKDDPQIAKLEDKLLQLKKTFDTTIHGELTQEQIETLEKSVVEIRNNFIQ